jgi:hypothetical protein
MLHNKIGNTSSLCIRMTSGYFPLSTRGVARPDGATLYIIIRAKRTPMHECIGVIIYIHIFFLICIISKMDNKKVIG